MEAKKIKLEEVKDGTISYALCKKEFTKAIDSMRTNGYDNPSLTLPFYIHLEQQFKGEKKPLMLIVLGLRKQPWKIYINKLKKDAKQKKQLLVGSCFLEKNADNTHVLHLNPKIGNAKLNLILKGGRDLFKKAKITVDLAEGSSIPEEVAQAEETAPEEDLTLLENELKTTWSVILSNYKGISTIKDEKRKKESSLMVFRDINQIEKMVANYESKGRKIADLIPSYAKNIALLKAKFEKSPLIQKIKEETKVVGTRLESLNDRLKEWGVRTIKY